MSIAIACPSPAPRRRWHAAFLALVPQITNVARFSFRHLTPEAKAEAVQETICNALQAFVRLWKLGKADIAYAGPLARYGVRQVLDGRKVGGKLNVRDVTSEYAQKAKGIHVERLDQYDAESDAWAEVLIEDRTAGPAEIVRTKLDMNSWLASLSRRHRKIAQSLAAGHRTSDVSKRFGLSEGRISQLRKLLHADWKRFIGDDFGPATAA